MCSDPLTFSGLDPAKVQQSGLKSGHITLSRFTMHLMDSTTYDTTSDDVSATFSGYDWQRLLQSRGQNGVTVAGACTVIPFRGSPATTDPVLPDMLDAGTPLTLIGPDGVAKQIASSSKGVYSAVLGQHGFVFGGFPLYLTSGGRYTLSGPGGKDVGAFSASLTAPQLNWTNSATISQDSINRSNGLTVTWTSGSGYVTITGTSFIQTPQAAGAIFVCVEDAAKGTFTVPPAVLLALPPCPAMTGSLTVGIEATPASFAASGLDVGDFTAAVSTLVSASYQ
jgi:hypothetical protein